MIGWPLHPANCTCGYCYCDRQCHQTSHSIRIEQHTSYATSLSVNCHTQIQIAGYLSFTAPVRIRGNSLCHLNRSAPWFRIQSVAALVSVISPLWKSKHFEISPPAFRLPWFLRPIHFLHSSYFRQGIPTSWLRVHVTSLHSFSHLTVPSFPTSASQPAHKDMWCTFGF